MMLIALLCVLAIGGLVFAIRLLGAARARKTRPSPEAVLVGAVTNFFDTLGIGSFAPTMAWFKLRKLVEDRLLPCTMLVGHTLPTVTQAIIFLVLLGVLVDPLLLVACSVALLVGALLGAPLATRMRIWIVRMIVGCALIVAALLYAASSLNLMPAGGAASGLPPALMAVAISANFLFGVLINFGIGNYAPSLIMFSLMGMDPRLAFPIMAGGAALAACGASVRHINIGKIDLRIATGMALGGIPAVLFAAFVVKSMPVETLRWLVVIVVLYTAVIMLRDAFAGRRAEPAPEAAAFARVDDQA